jgi:YbbR domain-containing protein
MWERLKVFITDHLATKLISLLIAILLWVVVLGSQSFEITKEIPLRVIAPDDLAIAEAIPEKVQFKLSGPKAFLRSILDRSENAIVVNLAGSQAGTVRYQFFADNIQVPLGVKVLSIQPPSIAIPLEPRRRKQVPVRLQLRGTPPEGYVIRKAEVNPAAVWIQGAQRQVARMIELVSLPIDVSQLRGNYQNVIRWDSDLYLIELEDTPPVATIEVEPISANFRLKNVPIQVKADHNYQLEGPAEVTLFVRIDEQETKSLSVREVVAEIDLRGHKVGSYRRPVEIRVPESVGIVKVTPENVHVTLY